MSAPGHKQKAKVGSRSDWETPRELFDLLDKRFHFTLDGAANWYNTKCPIFYSEEMDAFKQEPRGETIFVNPPYGNNWKAWISLFEKWAEHNTVVALVPSATDTVWWAMAARLANDVILLSANIEHNSSGRVKFIDPETGSTDGSNTTGSTVFVWSPFLSYFGRIELWDWKAELAEG